MGRTYYSAERDMERKVKRMEEEVRQIELREESKSRDMMLPADMWLESGLEEGGILVIHGNANVRNRLRAMLQRENYKVQTVAGGRQALSAAGDVLYDRESRGEHAGQQKDVAGAEKP